jgi:hypothetical protein
MILPFTEYKQAFEAGVSGKRKKMILNFKEEQKQ